MRFWRAARVTLRSEETGYNRAGEDLLKGIVPKLQVITENTEEEVSIKTS